MGMDGPYMWASLERQLGQFLISRNVKVMTPAAMKKGSIVQKDKKTSAKASHSGAAKRLQGPAAMSSRGPATMRKGSIVQKDEKASANAFPPGVVEWLRVKKLRQEREQRALHLVRQKLRGVSHA